MSEDITVNAVTVDEVVTDKQPEIVESDQQQQQAEEIGSKENGHEQASETPVPSTRETSMEPETAKDGAISGVIESQKEPAPISEPTVPQKKKRLTLQERLALAAAKGANKKKQRDVSSDNTPRTSVDIGERPSLELKEVSSPTPSVDEDFVLIPDNYLDLEHTELLEVVKSGLEKFSKFKETYNKESLLNKDLRTRLSLREQELKQKENAIADLSKSTTGNALSKKLEEKENIIKELMDEGSKLSMKELNLSNTIKKLKAKANEDSELIDDLQEKLNSTLGKLATLELKEVELKEFETKKDQITSDYKSLETKHSKLQEDHSKISQQYKDLKAQRFEQQLDSTKTRLDDELKKNKDLTLELNELNIKLKLIKDQSKNDVLELEEKIKKEKKKYQTLQDENASEIKRLEDKMESLRIMTESSTTSKNDDTTNEAFKKLSTSNELLQSQYTQAQENWKLIESSYLTKLAQAEKDINVLKQKDITSIKKIKVLASDLRAKNDELEESMQNETTLASDLSALRESLVTKDKLIKELQDNIQSLLKQIEKIKLDSERHLEEELAKQKEEFEKDAAALNKSFDAPIQSQGLYLNDLLPNPSFLKTRSVSNMSWNDNIAFGESSTTPRSTHVNSRKPSSAILNQFANSAQRTPLMDTNTRFFESPRTVDSPHLLDTSFHHQQDESYFEDDFAEDYNHTAANSPTSQNSSKMTLNKDVTASVVGSASGVNNKHIQIIGKLSSQIRRLEVESLTLKDEIATLNEAKNEANNEIVKLMKENSEVQDLQMEKTTLEIKVNELDKKYQRTLELLGEKSERVEELNADVADLKQLCREQVQQLVDLQTR